MAFGAEQISVESLRHQKLDIWAKEIRDYLLGRPSTDGVTVPVPKPQTDDLVDPPVRRWWTFDGKVYTSLDGPLSQNWGVVMRGMSRLTATFNPRLRFSARPDGVVDWPRTLARGPHRFRQEYVVHSSGVGLSEEEYAAVSGWIRWIKREWRKYKNGGDSATTFNWSHADDDPNEVFGLDQLRRWAQTARRSRWPLLHCIVAESIRPLFEPQELDSIPLPAAESTLFELLCLVRVARGAAPLPHQISWLTPGNNNNSIKLEGLQVHYHLIYARGGAPQPLAEA
jgi:hypothetical protein